MCILMVYNMAITYTNTNLIPCGRWYNTEKAQINTKNSYTLKWTFVRYTEDHNSKTERDKTRITTDDVMYTGMHNNSGCKL